MKRPFLLQAGEGFDYGALNIPGNLVWVKLASADTDGRCSIVEGHAEPMAGPPLHRHHREDEWFYVLEGEFRFVVDGQEILAGEGCSVFAPRGSAHTFQNIGEKKGRVLAISEPAGLDSLFAELAFATGGMPDPDPELILPIFEKYGLELLGPPLAVSDSMVAALQ